MRYLLIENNGEISEDALTLMGGSTKRDDSTKLGHFGSGNKYTIAALIRKGINFKIFGGLKEQVITISPYVYRGTLLDKIRVNGKETSLTVQMGPDWEDAWMCIREWVQNAKDEGGMNIIPNIESIEPREGKTRCYIQINDEIQNVIDNWDLYFTFDRVDALSETKHGKIFPNLSEDENLILFSKGIKCSNYKIKPSLYHYDGNIEMNESRIIKNDWKGRELALELLCETTNKSIIFNVLKNASLGEVEIFEKTVWDIWNGHINLSDSWREVIGDRKLIVSELGGWYLDEQMKYECFIVCNNLCKKIHSQFPEITIFGITDLGENKVPRKEVTLDKKKEFLLKECDRFFEECQYNVEYPVKVVRFQDAEVLGLADNGTIYVSEKCFENGKKQLVSVIIEENEHLKTGYKDNSRAFQNHWINLYISEKEERFGFFL
jgi:hypothetical protein